MAGPRLQVVGALPEREAGSLRFGLLGTLNARRRDRRRDLVPGAFFATVHLAAMLSLRLATHATPPTSDPVDETVTYLDVPPPPQAESPRTLVRPRPVVVSDAVKIPAAAAVTRPDRMAGFQELLAPREVKELPAPQPAANAVDERDFTGRGVVGGVAGGRPAPAVPAALAESLSAAGLVTDVHARAPRNEPLAMAMERVEVKPVLLNRDEIYQRLLDAYPPGLRAVGVEGTAIVQFVVDTAGRVEAGSARVISSTHALFAASALEVVPWGRFSPGRMSIEGRLEPVRVTVRVPLKWAMQH